MLKPPPMMTVNQPQAQVVTVHTLPQQRSQKVAYHSNTSKVLGGLQLVGGILAFIFGALLIWACSLAGVSGSGIWCGIFYVIAGTFGLYAGKHQTRGYITVYLVMCIVTTLLGTGVIISCAIALALNDSSGSNYCVSYSGFGTRGTVFECMLLIVGIIELITLIWGACIACQAVCGCGSPPPPSPTKTQKVAEKVEYSEKSMVVVGNKAEPIQNVSMLSEEPDQQYNANQQAYYPQDSSQQGYHPADTSQQGYYSQDASQQGYNPQDTSQQGYYDPNQQQGYYDPNQQGQGYHDPNQQGQAYYDPNQQGYYDQQGNYYPAAQDSSYDQQQQGAGYAPQGSQPTSPEGQYPPQGGVPAPAPAPKPRKPRSSRGSRSKGQGGEVQENMV